MNQIEPQYDDIWDALRACVAALGGPKKIGHDLRKELDPEKAGRWLSDCLNQERSEKLSLEQLLWLLRESQKAGCHDGMNFIGSAAGYTTTAIDSVAERTALVQSALVCAKNFQASIERLERAGLLGDAE